MMDSIYIIIACLGALLCLYAIYAYRLRRNRPNIQAELEIFPIQKKKSVTEILDEMLVDAKAQLEIDPLVELEKALNEELDKNVSITFPPATKVDSIEIELETTIDWFERQKLLALRQLKQYQFYSLEFIPDWTFEENGKTFETRGYLLDAANNLNDVVYKNLINKRRVVFYLSQDSDGIYHKRLIDQHDPDKGGNIITVQVWCSDI